MVLQIWQAAAAKATTSADRVSAVAADLPSCQKHRGRAAPRPRLRRPKGRYGRSFFFRYWLEWRSSAASPAASRRSSVLSKQCVQTTCAEFIELIECCVVAATTMQHSILQTIYILCCAGTEPTWAVLLMVYPAMQRRGLPPRNHGGGPWPDGFELSPVCQSKRGRTSRRSAKRSPAWGATPRSPVGRHFPGSLFPFDGDFRPDCLPDGRSGEIDHLIERRFLSPLASSSSRESNPH